MFQVEPERVMWATGAPKVPQKAATSEEETSEEKEPEPVVEEVDEQEEEIDIDRDPRDVLKDLRSKAKSVLATAKADIGAKRKQDLRAFSTTIKKLLSRPTSSTVLTDSLEAQFAEIQNQLNLRRQNQAAGTTSLPSVDGKQEAESNEASVPAVSMLKEETILTDADYNELYAALRTMQENPVDDSKPYATPWMPRDYMSAFAFIPRFLEVNHNICAAVYLRHPVARPGLAEVPSPYAADVHSTAFAWYLRRR